jgi:glycosyltransferase involved in cell wall biosynthesis
MAFPAWWQRLPRKPVALKRQATCPRITVITPSYQQAGFLEATIRSVLEQGYPNLDYHIIDGGSTDGSKEIIQYYAKHLSSWVCEPDSGQVDAIEKGIARADGEWINWINSDDLLAPGALWEVAAHGTGADLVAGTTQNFRGEHFDRKRASRSFSARGFVRLPLGSDTRWHQPGIWYRTAALRQTRLRHELHFRFDLDLLIRYLHQFPKVAYSRKTLAYFRLHEASKSLSQASQFGREHRCILQNLATDPGMADLNDDASQALLGLDWRDRLERLQQDRARSRWQRALELLSGAHQFKDAWQISATRDILGKIIFRGG